PVELGLRDQVVRLTAPGVPLGREQTLADPAAHGLVVGAHQGRDLVHPVETLGCRRALPRGSPLALDSWHVGIMDHESWRVKSMIHGDFRRGPLDMARPVTAS